MQNMTTATTLSKKQAEALWADLATAFANLSTALRKIIETRAWEPLGYDSFSAAWDDRMKDVPLATAEAKALAVYQMVDEGKDDIEIAMSLCGVGPANVEVLRRKCAAGVPAHLATPTKEKPYVVRQHTRKPPGAVRSVHVLLTDADYGRFVTLAERQGMTVAKTAERAILAYLDRGGEL